MAMTGLASASAFITPGIALAVAGPEGVRQTPGRCMSRE